MTDKGCEQLFKKLLHRKAVVDADVFGHADAAIEKQRPPQPDTGSGPAASSDVGVWGPPGPLPPPPDAPHHQPTLTTIEATDAAESESSKRRRVALRAPPLPPPPRPPDEM